MRTTNFPKNTSQRATRLATFRNQMADFARAERLRGLREARHLSQEDAAHEIGVSVKTVRAWEKGSGIRWTNAKTVARFYGVEAESIVSREPDDAPAPIEEEAAADEIRELRAELRQTRAELSAAIETVRRGQASLLRHQGLDEPPAEETGS